MVNVAPRAGVKGVDVVLVGRSAEREVLGGLLARAAEGYSGTLVLRGEAGVGKTALLDETFAAAMAGGIQTARLTGVEAETQLGYAACTGCCCRSPVTWSGYRSRSAMRCAARSGWSPGRRRTGSWSDWPC